MLYRAGLSLDYRFVLVTVIKQDKMTGAVLVTYYEVCNSESARRASGALTTQDRRCSARRRSAG